MKGRIKFLRYMIDCAEHAERSKDPHERLAAIEFQIELRARIEQLDHEEEPQLLAAEPQPEWNGGES